jgi:hypothetical protein
VCFFFLPGVLGIPISFAMNFFFFFFRTALSHETRKTRRCQVSDRVSGPQCRPAPKAREILASSAFAAQLHTATSHVFHPGMHHGISRSSGMCTPAVYVCTPRESRRPMSDERTLRNTTEKSFSLNSTVNLSQQRTASSPPTNQLMRAISKPAATSTHFPLAPDERTSAGPTYEEEKKKKKLITP